MDLRVSRMVWPCAAYWEMAEENCARRAVDALRMSYDGIGYQ
jgi:hypothetical protein